MLAKWFRRSTPRVYLGSLVVVPRTDLKRYVEWGGAGRAVEDALRATLVEIFSLPPADQRQEPRDDDLCLDVAIVGFQSGSGALLHLGGDSMPLFWRPKVTLIGRLRELASNRTHSSCKVTEKMPWTEFLARSINWRLAFGELTGADRKRMQALLYQASISLLQKLQKSI